LKILSAAKHGRPKNGGIFLKDRIFIKKMLPTKICPKHDKNIEK